MKRAQWTWALLGLSSRLVLGLRRRLVALSLMLLKGVATFTWRAAGFVAVRAIRAWSRWFVARHMWVHIEGAEHVPRTGPVVIVSRHFHYAYDGVIYLAILPRVVRILVALDWAPNRSARTFMEFACRLAAWPVILREDRLRLASQTGEPRERTAYSVEESRRYAHLAFRAAVSLLRAGDLLVVFPEAYPVVDPIVTRRLPAAAFLPFRPGYLRLVQAAQRDGVARVCIVPAGLRYEMGPKPHVYVRFGPALTLDAGASIADTGRAIESAVYDLSS
ncbi:MAG: hypothetical protein NVS2B16_04050 [Chloroflexota bacterium]